VLARPRLVLFLLGSAAFLSSPLAFAQPYGSSPVVGGYPPPPGAQSPPPSAAPPYGPARPNEKRDHEVDDKDKPGWDLDAEMLGLRGSSLGTSGSDRSDRTYGLSVAGLGASNVAGSIFNARARGRWLIGGGSGGFEGEFGGTLAVGLGFLLDGKQGPFVRIGVQGYILGNDSFFHSNIQFPQGSVGWHLGSRDGLLLEAGFTAGPMLDGRFNVGDEGRRRLGSSGAFGAYADAFVGPLTGSAEWIRTKAVSDPGTPVDALDGHVCLSTGRAKLDKGLSLCFDGRYTRGDVLFGSPIQTNTATSTYLGLSIGFGFAQSKPK
jgi:hypothetical protein